MKNIYLLLLAFSLCVTANAQTTIHRSSIDVAAKFTEHDDDFVAYIAKHVKKPDGINSDVKGQLVIKISIDENGKASVESISKSVSPEVDAAFTKAILAAPMWIPAKLKGKPVPSSKMAYYNVELNKATSTMTVDALNARPPLNPNSIYNAVQSSPVFPGGDKGFDRFLRDNIQYPAAAKSNNVSGRVFIQFIVERDGTLSDMKILRDPGSGLGDEAIRILKASPKWTPGKMRDTIVRTQWIMPVNFSL